MEKVKQKKLLSIKEVSQIYGLKESWLRDKVFKKQISYIKLARLVRFRPEDIEEMIELNLKSNSDIGEYHGKL